MIQINLLPDIKIVYLKVRRLRMIVFLVALFVITGCTIALLLMGLDTLVRQVHNISKEEEAINIYVDEFNSKEKDDIRKYLAIQSKFVSLGQLAEEKIDPNRLWTNGLFGGNPDLGVSSFLPAEYLRQIESYDFDFETNEFRISGEVNESADTVNFRDHFLYAYYEIGEKDDDGNITWSCPEAPGPESTNYEGQPDWTYCRMFSSVKAGSQFNPEIDARRKVSIQGQFTTESSNGRLFDKDVLMRVRTPIGCADDACVDLPGVAENAPQDFSDGPGGGNQEEGAG